MPIQSEASAQQTFNEAVAKLKLGEFENADSILNTALEKFPNDPNLLRLVGMSMSKQNRFEEAEKKFTHVIRLLPELALAHENLAEVLLPQGKFDEAIQSLRTAIRHNPSSEAASKKLREILALIGRGTEADDVFANSLEQNPDRNLLVQAMEFNRKGDTAKAEKIYRDVLRRDPENVDALRLMGALCARKENYSDGEAFFKRAVELKPDYWRAWINLGTALNEQQKFDESEQAYLRALALNANSVHTLEKLGTNCMNDGRLEDAVCWLEKSLKLEPTHFPSLLCLGHALKTDGRQEEAISAYRKCAESKPDFGEVYWSLANLKTFRFDDAEVEVMQQQLDTVSQTSETEDSEISFSFALGKACEDRKEFKTAFEYYSRGNQKKRPKVNYDPIEFQKRNDRVIEVFTKEFFDARTGHGCEDDSPILIVGLPRSGSTLLEQILASHSQVEGTAELHYLMRIATQTGLNRIDGIKYPECMHELEPHQVAGLGLEYVENTMHHRTGSRYFTDKMPNNFIGIGFLHAVLPNAKVIDARRHPLDSCLGTFKQLFARGQEFSYDFYDIAHYYTQYVRMMDHWSEVLPGKVLTVNYEDVVADIGAQAKRIASHCGLVWEEEMLRFHETKRAVKTASSEQVRQPIYTGSLNLWRRFEDDLTELIDYLEPVLEKLPNEQRPKSLTA